MKKKWYLIVVLGLAGLASSCASGKNRLNLVRLNMSKWEVSQVMGKEGQAVSSEKAKSGEIKEVWDYAFENPFTGDSAAYRFTFIDDKLTAWGPAK